MALSSVLLDPESVIPTEFYGESYLQGVHAHDVALTPNIVLDRPPDVRAETAPKAGWIPMYSFTSIVYIAALVSFVTLYQNEARKSTTETVILSYDNSGNDGYTCQMISKVSEAYQLPATYISTLSYNLINVAELGSQCVQDLAVADPCGSPMNYYSGTEEPMYDYLTADTYGAAALYSINKAYVYTTVFGVVQITSYDYSIGDYYDLNPVNHTITSSLAVDNTGSPIYLTRVDPGSTTVLVRRIRPVDALVYTIDAGNSDPVILNDNLYNVYVVLNTTFVALNIYAQPAVATELFALAEGDNILFAAVYHDGSAATVYYYTTLGAATSVYYCYKGGVTTVHDMYTADYSVTVLGMIADATYVYILLHQNGFGKLPFL